MKHKKSRYSYESRMQPLAPLRVYLDRIARNVAIALVMLMICLAIGVFGYHYFGDAGWVDSFHNASMILSGMGPVIEIKSVGGKIFSSLYALFSGVAFITNIGFILTPAVHRFFHKLHVSEDTLKDKQ